MMLVIIDLLSDRQGVTRYMRSASSAPDVPGWPSAQRPYPDEGTTGPVPPGPGPRSDPREGPGGRREVPFGPDISWPQGFRQLDPQSRDVLESAYGTGSVYQQPAIDDYGYGDPGYADPSYEGPRTRYPDPLSRGDTGSRPAASGWSGYRSPGTAVPGYQVPDSRPQPQDFTTPPAGPRDIYPVTGAQEALPDTAPTAPTAPRSPQPAPRGWAAQDSGGAAGTGSSAYPEQWYGHPRLDDRVLGDAARADRAPDGSRPADPRPSDVRPAAPRPSDVRPAEPRPSDVRPA